MILAIVPELLSRGGIQRISQQVCAVLQETAHKRDEPCEIFSLNDPKGAHQLIVEGRSFGIRGFGKNRVRFAIASFLQSRRSRIVYVGHPNFAPLGLVCQFFNRNLHYIVSAFGLEVWNPLSTLRRLGVRRATAVTSISEFTASKLVDVQGVDRARIHVIPCVITAELLAARSNGTKRDSRKHSQKILLAVGRLDSRERQKGLDEVILALERLGPTFPDAVFVIAGEGDDRTRLEALAREHGLADRVVFKGGVDDSELMDLYKNCDVFSMPSSQEGFGIVFLEAMAFRKPVIGGNHGGTPEVIVDNETGYLVVHGDVDALAGRISQLLADPLLCKRMGDAGRRRLEEHYTFDVLRKRLMALFSEFQSSPPELN
jgi:glycosyltransferase involved in cell wall biosynthesis